jgi:hypothetical protein
MTNYSPEIYSNLIPLFTYWLILIIGSFYIYYRVYYRGGKIYQMIKDSLIGKITKALVNTLMVEMFLFGLVTTALAYAYQKSLYLILPTFFIWFISFITALNALRKVEKEANNLISPK